MCISKNKLLDLSLIKSYTWQVVGDGGIYKNLWGGPTLWIIPGGPTLAWSLWPMPYFLFKEIFFVLHYPAGLGESFDFLKSSKLTTRLWSREEDFLPPSRSCRRFFLTREPMVWALRPTLPHRFTAQVWSNSVLATALFSRWFTTHLTNFVFDTWPENQQLLHAGAPQCCYWFTAQVWSSTADASSHYELITLFWLDPRTYTCRNWTSIPTEA